MIQRVIQLTRIDQYALEIGGQKQVVIIDQLSHLGRSPTVTDHKARETPLDILGAKIAIEIESTCEGVSRNHALICPPQDYSKRWECPGWIEDLNSMNYTALNRKKLKPGEKTILHKTGAISLAEQVIFEYQVQEREILPYSFVASGENQQNPNYCLMVGHDGGNLEGTINNIKKLKEALEPRGFEGNVTELVNATATKDNILDALKRYKALVTEGSIFIFYFSGHGSDQGLYLGNGVFHTYLAQEVLLNALSGFRGKKLLILDGCYTSSFSDHQFPQSTILIGTKGLAYQGSVQTTERPQHPPNTRFVMGYCTRALYEILRDHPHRIGIEEVVGRMRENPDIMTHQQTLYLNSCTLISLPSRKRRTSEPE